MSKIAATVYTVLLISAVSLLHPAWAQNSQQDLMKSCNAQAGSQKLSGDARKSFMSDCLSGKTSASTLTPQQQKMKTCNAQASSQKLTGSARQQFMSGCLKK